VTDASGDTEQSASRTEVASSPLIQILEEARRNVATNTDGEVPSYIPELARAQPNHFGIAVATVDGEAYESGDSLVPFTIQSISKPLVFGMALAERGGEAVTARVGVEPSGHPFNSVTVDAATNGATVFAASPSVSGCRGT
jgi:glutaminase